MLSTLEEVLKRRGASGWLVGGTVRDRRLGRFSPDVDVVVDDDPETVAASVATELGRPWFPLSRHFRAYRVLGDGGRLDVSGLRPGGLTADLAARDFTVNAMAERIGGGGIVDPFGGGADLDRKRLVAVSDHIFRDDPLRLLRAVRLVHLLGLSLDPALEELVARESWRLVDAAPERISAEVGLTLEGGRAADAASTWQQFGLLQAFLPEVDALTDVFEDDVTRETSFQRTLATLAHLDRILGRPEELFPEAADVLLQRLGNPVDGMLPRPVVIRFGALVHDVGKAGVEHVDKKEGRVFPGHAMAGGHLAELLCRRLRLSGSATSLVCRVTEEHTGLAALLGGTSPSRRSVLGWLRDARPWEPEVVLIATASALATGFWPETLVLETARGAMAAWVRRHSGQVRPLPLDGVALMADLQIDAGPLLGRLLSELTLAWEAEEVTDQDEVLALARSLLESEVGEAQSVL